MSNKSLKYPIAVNLSGELISASNADKKEQYHCLECQTKMVPRQGEIKRHHFAHVQSGRECNPESFIHKAGKRIIAEKINYGLTNDTPVIFSWHCPGCASYRKINVLDHIAKVDTEKSVKDFNGSIARPDLLLSNKEEKPIVAVEIVYTHEPEEQAKQIMRELGISVFRVDVKPDDDLLTIWNHCIHGDWDVRLFSCPGCQQIEKEKEEREQKRQRDYEQREKDRLDQRKKQEENIMSQITDIEQRQDRVIEVRLKCGHYPQILIDTRKQYHGIDFWVVSLLDLLDKKQRNLLENLGTRTLYRDEGIKSCAYNDVIDSRWFSVEGIKSVKGYKDIKRFLKSIASRASRIEYVPPELKKEVLKRLEEIGDERGTFIELTDLAGHEIAVKEIEPFSDKWGNKFCLILDHGLYTTSNTELTNIITRALNEFLDILEDGHPLTLTIGQINKTIKGREYYNARIYPRHIKENLAYKPSLVLN